MSNLKSRRRLRGMLRNSDILTGFTFIFQFYMFMDISSEKEKEFSMFFYNLIVLSCIKYNLK